MLKIENLNKYFNKNKKNEIHVINNTTLSFNNTGLVCILGESGSGKTTLLNVMGGLDSFSDGIITVDDERFNKYSASKMDKLRNRKYGYIFQNYYLLSDYTVEYNIVIALKCLNMNPEQIEERVNYVLEAVEMRKYKKKLVSELSGGQRQRVAIARALAKTPDVIFADEPTGNLDENNTLRIMSILKKISKNCLVILVTHEQRIAEFFGDRIIKIKDGSIIEDKLNVHSTSYVNSNDIAIYLKELEKKEISIEDNHVNIYSDGTQFPVNIYMIFKAGKLFIVSDADEKIEYLTKESETILVDDVKPVISMENIDDFEFSVEKVPSGGKNKLSVKEILSMAWYNIKNVADKQIFMYLVFVISSVLMLLSFSDFYRVLSAKPYEKVTSDSHYVVVNCVDSGTADDAYRRFKRDSGIDGDIYAYKARKLNVTSNDYAQVKNLNQTISNFSYVDIDKLNQEQILYGHMPENEYEIVVDKAVLEGVLGGNNILATISEDVEDFLNETVSFGTGVGDLLICGISNNEEMSIYVSKDWIEWSGDTEEDIYNKKNFQIYTDEPQKVADFFNSLNDEYIKTYGEINRNRKPVIEASYVYGNEIKVYQKSISDDIRVRTIITTTVVILSIVVLAFTMKANSLRRTEELVVYRLIGITPGNILLSYIFEIIIITIFTQIVPIVLVVALLKFLSGVNAFEMIMLCPWNYIVLLIVALIVLNVVVSVMSVIGIIKRPPAQLAAKN